MFEHHDVTHSLSNSLFLFSFSLYHTDAHTPSLSLIFYILFWWCLVFYFHVMSVIGLISRLRKRSTLTPLKPSSRLLLLQTGIILGSWNLMSSRSYLRHNFICLPIGYIIIQKSYFLFVCVFGEWWW